MYTTIEGLSPRLAILGHIKIGRKGEKRLSGGGNEYRLPEKLDHFVITKREKGVDDNFIIDEDLTAQIGKDIKEIDIRLLDDDVTFNFPHRLACYVTQADLRKSFGIESKSKRCYCTGDGREATRLEKAGKETIPCNPISCDIYNGKFEKIKCKPLARLIFTLPQMNFVGGCFDFVTTSGESIGNIKGSFALIQKMTQGIIAGIPLKLKMYAATDDTGQGQVKNWKVMIKYDGTETELMETAKQIALVRSQSSVDIKRLKIAAQKAIEYVENEEEEDIAEEFFPVEQSIQPTTVEYAFSVELLEEIKVLAVDSGLNDAGLKMMLGQFKGREKELRDQLREQLKGSYDTQPKVKAKTNVPEKTKDEKVKAKANAEDVKTEAVDNNLKPTEKEPTPPPIEPSEQSTGLLDDVSDIKTEKEPSEHGTMCLVSNPSTETAGKQDEDNKFAKERDRLINAIADFKNSMEKKQFDNVRKDFPSKIDAMSIGDLRNLKEKLDKAWENPLGVDSKGNDVE